jgi:glycosyltransferase involved in cell wall biosynthesis
VLALDNPFKREVIADCGILLGNDPSELAEHLIGQFPDEGARCRWEAPGRILAHYNWERIADQYEDYFERLVRGEKPAPNQELGM